MFAFKLNADLVHQVRRIMGWTGGGVHKRIDENRELLELLRDKAPDFLELNPWVISWLESNDTFLSALARAVPITDGRFLEQALMFPADFPRPWQLERRRQST